MSTLNAHLCDVTGEVIAEHHVPLLVRITVAVAPGAERDPQPEDLSQFLRAMLFQPDGSPRKGQLDLAAHVFDACFRPDMVALAPAFGGRETPQQELARLRRENTELKALHGTGDT